MRVAEVQITKRHVRAMCAQSEGVRHFDRERAQARCVVATTVLPHSCRVGRALLHPERHLGLGEGTTSVARVPSGTVLSHHCECHREDELLAGSCQPSTHPAFLVRCDHCCPVQ